MYTNKILKSSYLLRDILNIDRKIIGFLLNTRTVSIKKVRISKHPVKLRVLIIDF